MSARHYHHLLVLDHHLLRAVHYLGTQLLGDALAIIVLVTLLTILLVLTITTPR